MSAFERLADYLFTHPGGALTLDSGTLGAFIDAQGGKSPIYKQPLRGGQILLLFAGAVPQECADDFLAGRPIHFAIDTPRGALWVQMQAQGEKVTTRVVLATGGEELISTGKGLLSGSPPEPSSPTRSRLLAVIGQLVAKRASHLHLAADRFAFARIDGRLICLDQLGTFTANQLREAVLALAPPATRDTLMRGNNFEFCQTSKYSVFYVRGEDSRDGLRVTVRAFPLKVPSPASLGLPDELSQVLTGTGLWVVAGAAGQGTSTTVASLVQDALERRPLEICTLDSPLDYVLDPKQGLVQQLEVGVHVPTFAAGLEDARRGDADLVVVGQLDDGHTLSAAVSLAARGRLVLGVVHAKTALVAVQNLFELTPPSALAGVLRGVFAQTLVPRRIGGRSLCWELLPGNEMVRRLLREGALEQLPTQLSRPFDVTLLELVRRGEVDPALACALARDRAAFEAKLSSRAA